MKFWNVVLGVLYSKMYPVLLKNYDFAKEKNKGTKFAKFRHDKVTVTWIVQFLYIVCIIKGSALLGGGL